MASKKKEKIYEKITRMGFDDCTFVAHCLFT